MALDLSSLQKAVSSLERAVKVASTMIKGAVDTDQEEVIRAGVIQNFEFTYELCWKFIQRWIRENKTPEDADNPRTRKELFRLAAEYGLISDPLPWFDFGSARNRTSHIYDEEIADEVYQAAVRFLPYAGELLEALKAND